MHAKDSASPFQRPLYCIALGTTCRCHATLWSQCTKRCPPFRSVCSVVLAQLMHLRQQVRDLAQQIVQRPRGFIADNVAERRRISISMRQHAVQVPVVRPLLGRRRGSRRPGRRRPRVAAAHRLRTHQRRKGLRANMEEEMPACRSLWQEEGTLPRSLRATRLIGVLEPADNTQGPLVQKEPLRTGCTHPHSQMHI